MDQETPGGKRPANRREASSEARGIFALDRDMLGPLAHELRTPVQVLIGYLDMLREELEGELGSRARDVIERMHINVQDLAQTIDNLVEFVLTEENAQSHLDENISVGSLIGDIQPAMEAANLRKGLRLEFDLSEAPAAIRAPRQALRSIIRNLALNAIKFTETGSVTVTLRDATAVGKGALEIQVRDTGPGISPETFDLARKPFVQLSRSNSRRHRGLGLGLTLVHRHVAALGGSIELRPTDSQGALFTVHIPVRPVRLTGRRPPTPPLPPVQPHKPSPGVRR